MRVLILGGTTEASAIARALADDRRFNPVLSLAGRTRSPAKPPIPWRVGGFGGVAGLTDYLQREGMQALIDATHPFAARMKANAAQVAIPRVVVLRPAWLAQPGDDWSLVPNMQAAAEALGHRPRQVFLTVGQGELAVFGPPHRYLVRSVDPPPDAPVGATIITARGPFTEGDDRALMQSHAIDTLVTKNSGGSAVASKLAAARALGVRVIMVDRPPPPAGVVVRDAAGALAWLHAQAALRGV
ncbi:cobalt-precorrin-6A reductase [Acidisphaera sp. L21]|uniref:cobalt-precorrin-6A reductase n=1 Tax=Acidisphaera sp. L21 TaxID=1641851 RepID=UPI00131AB6B6|nr:cobalt-precorrin-6A reductase [Acidisphaera sp. L21]